MSADLEAVVTELRALVVAVWPEVTADKVYEAEHVARVPFEALAEAGLPYAVLVVPEAKPADLGLGNLMDFLDVEVWWVGHNQGPAAAARAKVKALRDYLWARGDYTSFQLWDDPPPQGGAARGLMPNQIFLAKKLPVLAGRVTARLCVGEEAS